MVILSTDGARHRSVMDSFNEMCTRVRVPLQHDDATSVAPQAHRDPVEGAGKERREEQKDDTSRFLIAQHMRFTICSALCSSGSACDLCMLLNANS